MIKNIILTMSGAIITGLILGITLELTPIQAGLLTCGLNLLATHKVDDYSNE